MVYNILLLNIVYEPTNVCLGKEWHRFPAHYFIPNDNINVTFVRANFHGLLPKLYERGSNGTFIIPTNMNDQNEEEMSRYIDINNCHYFVELNLIKQKEPDLREDNNWKAIFVDKFIDLDHSKSPYRSYYIPKLSEKYIKYGSYIIFKNRRLYNQK